MIKCSVCGGEVDSIGNNQYRCRYCMHEFSGEDFRTETKSHVENRSNEGVNVFDKNINGVLEITCRFPGAVSAGSGLLIDRSGYAITNTHVVTNNAKPCNDITVKIAGENVRASIVALGDNDGGHGTGVDLALIRLSSVPFNATVIELANFDQVRIGEQVYVIGNSLGDGTCITSGIVSDKRRVVSGKTLMMTDCAINGGNSGGPIFNRKGVAIGVIVSSRIKSDGSATEGMNYAIPSDIVKAFLNGHYSQTQLTGGAFEMPPKQYTTCPKCGTAVTVGSAGNCFCSNCGNRWNRSIGSQRAAKKALAPCPKCKSWNTNVENGIFYCEDCGFEGG